MKKIRVLRLLEYIYDSVEMMEADMKRWTIHSNRNGCAMKSVSLPLETLNEDETTNEDAVASVRAVMRELGARMRTALQRQETEASNAYFVAVELLRNALPPAKEHGTASRGDSGYFCHCGMGFHSPESLDVHIRAERAVLFNPNVHGNAGRADGFFCLCGKQFETLYKLATHTVTSDK